MKRRLVLPALLSVVVSAMSHADVTLDTVTTTAGDEQEARPATQKLLKVPGAGNDPLRALEALPGVVFGNGREAAPAIRGSSPDDNAYYLDFLPVGYLFHNDGSSIINDALVEGFQLYPAAFGPEFNGATGAVITAESRSPYFDEQQTIVDLSLLRAGVLFDVPVNEQNAAFLSARMSLFQFYLENIIDDEDFEFTTVPEFYDYQGAWEYRPDATSALRFQAVGARDKAGLDFDEDSDFVQQDPALSGGLEAEQYFNSQGVVYETIFDSGISMVAGLSQLEESFEFSIGQGNFIDAKSNRYGFRSQFSYPISLTHELEFGAEFAQQNIGYKGRFSAPPCDEFSSDCRLVSATEELRGSGDFPIRTTQLNLADIWQINADWQLTSGALASYNEFTGNTYLEPRLKNRLTVSEPLVWTLGYGRYHALSGNPGQYTPEFGNRELDETRSTHYVTGLEYQLKDGLTLTTEVYYKDIRDIVVSRAPQSEYPTLTLDEYNNLPRYTNEGSGEAWGVEALLNADFSERWYGWVSVTLSRTERENDVTGERFRYSYDKPVVINTVVNYQLNDDWTLGFKWRFESGQLVTPLEGVEEDETTPGLFNPIYGAPFSERLPSYHRLDVRADRSYDFTRWSMDLYVEVINLYARQNVIGYQYLNADYSEREDVNDLPPIASVGVRLIF
ncbi:TonB-dependent receptor plug domain-containing protein [Thalassolituus sp.]|uniref:TonB-dependent receptor plug domain-containing protein n=1 Tax=Thalassolituus sp. TaxID=2030822 RepID=UPI0035167852